MVVGSRADLVQARCHGIQSTAWSLTELLGPSVHIPDVSGRRALHSACTNLIMVPPVTSTSVKLAFHDADTDSLAGILADTSDTRN